MGHGGTGVPETITKRKLISFASGECPSSLQLLQGARMQLRWLGLVWGTRKPSAGRKQLGACAARMPSLIARCKNQRRGDTVPTSPRGPGSALRWGRSLLPSEALPACVLPLGDLPLQILIQLTLLSLGDLGR